MQMEMGESSMKILHKFIEKDLELFISAAIIVESQDYLIYLNEFVKLALSYDINYGQFLFQHVDQRYGLHIFLFSQLTI
jgi:hypothetical protein